MKRWLKTRTSAIVVESYPNLTNDHRETMGSRRLIWCSLDIVDHSRSTCDRELSSMIFRCNYNLSPGGGGNPGFIAVRKPGKATSCCFTWFLHSKKNRVLYETNVALPGYGTTSKIMTPHLR